MYYVIKENLYGGEIERGTNKNELEDILFNIEYDDIQNDCYVEDFYYIEKVYEYDDIEKINEGVAFNINCLYSGFRICDINTYKAFEDDELFSRILLVDKKHLIVLLSLSITVDNELNINNFEVIKKNYCI